MKKNQILVIIAIFFIGSYFVISCRHEPPISGCDFTYSAWSSCDSTGHQTRTYFSNPSGCTGTPPADSLFRTCGGVVYTFTYGTWSACVNGVETRSYTSDPVGGTPPTDSITRSCGTTNYTFTYGSWTACVNGVQTRPFTSNPAGGIPPTDSITRSCTPPPPPSCTFTYSAWSTCLMGVQTRTYTSSPAGCTGTPPSDSLTRICGTPACTFTYGAWTTCSNGTQTRTYTSSPAGCTGTPPADSITRSCTMPACTFTYGAWTTCSNGTQTRTYTSSPAGCTGTPPTDSITRSCTVTCPTITVTGTPTRTTTNCSNNGTIVASATGGTAPYTYSKNGTTFQSTATFSALAIGSYTITAKDANGCTGTVQVAVSGPATVSFNTDIKPTINATCGRANVSCHSHSDAWTTYSDIVGTSTGTTWTSNLSTFLKRIRGTSGSANSSCPLTTSSGNHDMPPSSTTTWTNFVSGALTNWISQGYPNN